MIALERVPEAGLSAPAGQRPFRLMQFFFLASLIGTAVVTACLIWFFRSHAVAQIVEQGGQANADLARAFANTVGEAQWRFIARSTDDGPDLLRAHPAIAGLRAEVRRHMRGLQVVKVKVYNLQGITVFSTDERQIGEHKAGNEGFRRARAGELVSDITRRDRFDAFDKVLSNRDLIFSYIPVARGGSGEPQAVFELYADVTDLLQAQKKATWQVAAGVLGLLAALFLFLLLIVRKADAIIREQEAWRVLKEEEVRHLAYHDALTGLPNRIYFAERLRESVALARRQNNALALMFIDLDRFKAVNDTLGHAAGDALLKEVAGRIRAALRDGDLLFRVGGDEFTATLPGMSTLEDASRVARRIHEAVAQPVPIGAHDARVGATIGIAFYPRNGVDVETLLRNADEAMYAAKAQGRGSHAFSSAIGPVAMPLPAAGA